MAGNYITNVNLLVFPNGKKFESYLDGDLKQSEKNTALDLIVTEAENWVDSQLKGRTAVPATHIISDCKQIALEYARALMLRDNPIITDDDKEKRAKQYFEQAENMIKGLRYCASADVAVASSQNTGDGTISVIAVDDNETITESWIVRCISEGDPSFDVIGSKTGALNPYDITDGVYPTQADSEKYGDQRKLSFTITAGATDFADEDEFTFKTYAASWNKETFGSGEIVLG